jgi:lysozyme family protein
MSDQLTKGTDWAVEGNAIGGRGEGRAQFRGLQADLNLFGETLGFDRVKVDGMVGHKTVAAVNAVVNAVTANAPGVAAAGIPPHGTAEEVATHAPAIRGWLLAFALGALNVSRLRRYVRGAGKDWNTKDQIAYGAGEVHGEFQALQTELNRFAEAIGFAPLAIDGFIGPKTAVAVTQIYEAAIKKNPGLAATPFPPPDSKEEAAEYAAFIRWWLSNVAAKAVLAEAGA